jgi:hypothetical protein
MTISTKTTLDVSDIQAIEFECMSCHSKVTMPVNTFGGPPISCMTCESREQWFIPGSQDHANVVQLGRIFRDCAKNDKKRFAMRFEISNPVEGSRQ